jgi:hypothetical protein
MWKTLNKQRVLIASKSISYFFFFFGGPLAFHPSFLRKTWMMPNILVLPIIDFGSCHSHFGRMIVARCLLHAQNVQKRTQSLEWAA